jgi:thiol-disulfide isomerase/thioredoxin
VRRLVFVLVLVLGTAAARQQQDLGLPLGTKAPGAVLQTLDGKNVDLASYIGKGPVVIEFWATWCENCRELEPAVMKAVKDYAGKVTFIGVAVSVQQSPERVKKYVAQHGIMHTILYDTHGNATGAYDVPATSYVVVINK